MIGRLEGRLLSLEPPLVLIDVGGVGYEVEVPLSVLDDIPGTGEQTTLIIHHHITEATQSLFGFTHESQRLLFRNLMKVSGVGAKMALAILSGMAAAQFVQAVNLGDVTALTKIPGIGKKTAERLVMELRDKLADSTGIAVSHSAAGQNAGAVNPNQEAVTALQSLGYKAAEAERLIQSVTQDGMDTASLLKAALQQAGAR